MSTIQFTATTAVTPAQFVAAITDFGPGRSQTFPNTDDSRLVVHDSGPDWAEVTEGKGAFWERLRYDWSDPARTRMTTTDSNIWSNDSGHIYAYHELPDGRTAIDVTIVREGRNAKGRLIGGLLGIAGGRVFGNQFAKTIKAVEARQVAEGTSAGSPSEP